MSAKIYRKRSESNTNSIEPQVEVTPSELEQINVNRVANDLGIILIVYLLVMVGAIAFAKFWINRKSEQKQNIQFWRHLNRVPCKKCQFFAENNPYIKCAVNPFTVLTKEAVDCSDYCPKTKK
ncbi:MAG: hypothetical protein KME17_22045 [Cyanosarcina radialis HA8281-LM2]|nr:hypothetical protein [Cyanosarcina radialis HA8281-LM2]